ncbi:MAG: baseplate J/gp47 family protein [Candidatus Levybacteria bacterium]|nr:baseplate J/gp47 family protein [Candidatus Levybacteria bacterium]
MKLPIKLPFQKKDDVEYYLSLLLGEEKAHATVFAEKNSSIEIRGEHEEQFPVTIEKISDEDLLNVLDKTISNAESKLPDGCQTKKTVFGVKENWIEDGKIKKDYLSKLKKVCDGLGLQPIGFLVTHEAIAHLLQKEEGAPVSAILCEIGTDTLAVSVIRAGKVLETKRVPIAESIPKTIDKTLHFFTSYEILPSRIIVFNEAKHEKLSQDLITHQWSKTLPFLHVPQIKILPKKFEPKSILFGAATQMGFEVLDKFDMPIIPDQTIDSFSDKKSGDLEKTEVAEETMFGFVTDKDIAKIEHTPTTAIAPSDPIETYNQEFFNSEHEESQLFDEEKPKPRWQTKTHGLIRSLKTQFTHVLTLLPLKKLNERFPTIAKRKGIIFVPPLIIGILLIVVLLYIFTLKATVVLHVNQKTVEQEQNITFSTNQPSDTSQNIIAAEAISTTEEGTVSTQATGKKEIGEKAKGSLTLYNSTTKEQSIAKGTTITSSTNLQFVLEDTVKIASSGGASDGSKTAKGNVTAKEIGKEYNLPSGTKFTVGGFGSSEVEAKNDDAFAGGSKKEITVIAKADTAKLLDELPKKLTEKAKENLQTKVTNDQTLLPVFLTTTVDKKTFNKDIGEEATSVSLTGSITFTSAAYNKNDLHTLALTLLSEGDKELSPAKESLSYDLTDVSDSNGDISAKAAIKGYLLPKIDKETMKQNLSGKSFEEAHSILKNVPQVNQVEISLIPPLPLPSFLPRIANNITIDVKKNE